MTEDTVRIGLLGLGTVGAGTVALLQRNAAGIAQRTGKHLRVVAAAVRDLQRTRPVSLDGIRLSDRPDELVTDPGVDVVVELMGGEEPARELVLAALSHGKPVVTANKALIALHGNEIFAAANRHNLTVAFEAAVAGGIPIIKALREAMAGNRINRVAGIINGTGNFILSEMEQNDRDFSDVLIEAQRLGYAEADPTFDIEGIDAAHKLTILAAIAFGTPLNFDAVYTEGISRISRGDVTYAGELGYRIKHLGIASMEDGRLSVRVHPTLIPDDTPLANVSGVTNAILVESDPAGHTLYYGPGAGAGPTASAVVADLIDTVRMLGCDTGSRVPPLGLHFEGEVTPDLLPMDDVQTAFYLRMQAIDRPGVLGEVLRIFGDAGISIEAIRQREPEEEASSVDVIMVTHRVREGAMRGALDAVAALDSITAPVTRIRLEQLGD